MGHFDQGSSRAFCSHVLRYGLRTIRGRTGGAREAPATLARSAARAKLGERIASVNGEPSQTGNKGLAKVDALMQQQQQQQEEHGAMVC
jgi:hypothetical protein